MNENYDCSQPAIIIFRPILFATTENATEIRRVMLNTGQKIIDI